jgi:toxin CcdB
VAKFLRRQFDVFRNPSPTRRPKVPLLVDLQSDLVSDPSTVVVAAIVPAHKVSKASRLYPTFRIERKPYMMLTPNLAAVPRALLVESVTSLEGQRDAITAAIDVLFFGI